MESSCKFCVLLQLSHLYSNLVSDMFILPFLQEQYFELGTKAENLHCDPSVLLHRKYTRPDFEERDTVHGSLCAKQFGTALGHFVPSERPSIALPITSCNQNGTLKNTACLAFRIKSAKRFRICKSDWGHRAHFTGVLLDNSSQRLFNAFNFVFETSRSFCVSLSNTSQ